MGDLVAHWYYVQSGEKKGPFAPDQIKTLIQAGVIDGHTSVWSEVSGEWKPLNQTELQGLVSDKTSSPNIPANTAISKEQAESDEAALSKLFDAPRETSPHQSKPTVSPPPDHQKTYDHNHFYRNNTLSSALRFFVWINIIIASGEFYGIYKVKNDINQSYRKVLYFESSEWLSVIFTPILIGVVLFMMWKYRSTANLIRLRGGQSVTAAGAVYWYFVPIAWFWKPYQAMRNLLDGYDIGSHRSLNAWWITFWGGALVAFILAIMQDNGIATRSDAEQYVNGSIVIGVLNIINMFFALDLIKNISVNEAKLVS